MAGPLGAMSRGRRLPGRPRLEMGFEVSPDRLAPVVSHAGERVVLVEKHPEVVWFQRPSEGVGELHRRREGRVDIARAADDQELSLEVPGELETRPIVVARAI